MSVLTVTTGSDDGGYRVFDLADRVNVQRGEIEDLSDSSFLSRFDVVCIFGVDNNLSPLIRLTLENYVSSGGGMVLSDIQVSAANIELLDDIAPVYCENSGVNFLSGNQKWTDEGVLSPIYDREFAKPNIRMLNTILETDFSKRWSVLYVFDTSTDVSDYDDTENDVTGVVYLSSDYDIAGDRIVGYFAGVYKNGVFNVDENE